MPKILIVITGQRGILNASLEMARRLSAAGHELHLAAPRPVGDMVTCEGWTFTELPEIMMEPAGNSRLGNGVLAKAIGMLKRFIVRGQRRRVALQNTRPLAFRMLVKRHQPELLLIDVELHEYIIAAHGMGVNYTLLSQWYSLWWLPGLPYLLTPTIPGVGEEGEAKAINQVWQQVAEQRKKTFRKLAKVSLGADRRSTLLRLAAENNFPTELIRSSFWPGPFSYDELPVIAMAPLEMEFPHQPRKHLHYVGPMVHAGRQEQSAISHRGHPVDVIVAASGTKKLIVVTVSTLSSGDTNFLARLVQAVGQEADWEVLLGLGGKLSVEDVKDTVALSGSTKAAAASPQSRSQQGARGGQRRLGDLPANVHAFDYLPQLKVLASADLSVNHGGIHTIHECLHFGVPMLVYSGKRSDQPGCAARVHYHGIGLMADKDVDDVGTIRDKITTVLTGPYRTAVRKMRNEIEYYRKNEILENLVVGMVRKKDKV